MRGLPVGAWHRSMLGRGQVIRVSTKLFAFLTSRVSEEILASHPEGLRAGIPIELDLPEKSTLAELLAHLGLPEEDVIVMFVNGRARELDHILADGDQVGMFPPVAGG